MSKDLNLLTLDQIEEMEAEGTVEIEINDGKVQALTLTDAEGIKIKETIKAMSDVEQEAAVAGIKDSVLWAEIHRRYDSTKATLHRVRDALVG